MEMNFSFKFTTEKPKKFGHYLVYNPIGKRTSSYLFVDDSKTGRIVCGIPQIDENDGLLFAEAKADFSDIMCQAAISSYGVYHSSFCIDGEIIVRMQKGEDMFCTTPFKSESEAYTEALKIVESKYINHANNRPTKTNIISFQYLGDTETTTKRLAIEKALADGFLMAKNILKTSLNNNKMIVIKLYNHFVYLIEKSLFKDGYKIDKSKSTNIYDFFSNEFSDIWLNKPISENTPLTICPETNDFGRLLNLNKCLKDRPINISKGNDLVYVFVQNAFSVFVVAMSDINDSGISVWRVKENQKGEIDFDISRGNEWLIKHLLKDRIGIL